MAKILIVAPYQNAFPPRNGGQLRVSNLTAEIARHHDVHYLSLQADAPSAANAWDENRCGDIHFHYSDASHPKSLFARAVRALQYRWHVKKLSAPTNSAILSILKDTRRRLQEEPFDCIFLVSLPPKVFQSLKKRYSIPIIYDAHNVDSTLIKQQLDSQPDKEALQMAYQSNLEKEQSLHLYCDSAFACSELDKQQLDRLNQNKLPIFTIPNGVECNINALQKPQAEDAHNLLFCGSLDYFPNKEGLHWFHEKVWPKLKASLPSVQLSVIGRTQDTTALDPLKGDPQIKLLGAVDDVRPYYQKASASIVPLNTGSGTRLKILESMSLGTPVISTSKGCEGIEATHGTHIRIADQADDFHDQLLQLLKDPGLRDTLRKSARQLVEAKYHWQVIGEQANTAILQTISNSTYPRS